MATPRSCSCSGDAVSSATRAGLQLGLLGCLRVCECVARVCVYLHVEDGKDANLVSQHALCPVLVHSSDYGQYLILDREEMSETGPEHTRTRTRTRTHAHYLWSDSWW